MSVAPAVGQAGSCAWKVVSAGGSTDHTRTSRCGHTGKRLGLRSAGEEKTCRL